jgi:alcohol dehydrogenase
MVDVRGGLMTLASRLYYMPTRIVHGLGSVSALAAHVGAVGGKVFVCTDKGLSAAGVTARVTAVLEEAGVPFFVFDDVEEDPGVKTVSAGAAAFAAEGCDVVVALGGGSPMCAGKGIALVAANGGTLTDYEGFQKAAKAPYPVIAIPTTAGSGTEVSKVTILSDEARGFKMSILDERTFPTVAILDGSLMESLPAWPALVAAWMLWRMPSMRCGRWVPRTSRTAWRLRLRRPSSRCCRRRRSPPTWWPSSACLRPAR